MDSSDTTISASTYANIGGSVWDTHSFLQDRALFRSSDNTLNLEVAVSSYQLIKRSKEFPWKLNHKDLEGQHTHSSIVGEQRSVRGSFTVIRINRREWASTACQRVTDC